MLFSHQNVKSIFSIFMEICPINSIISHVCLFYLFPPRNILCATFLECFPSFCVLLLDTIDRSANEMHDFTGHIFRVGEIIACTPRKSKEKIKQQSEHSTAILEHELADIYDMKLIQG